MGLNQAAPQRSSVRRSFGRSKRFSITRSLDDLEVIDFYLQLRNECWREVYSN